MFSTQKCKSIILITTLYCIPNVWAHNKANLTDASTTQIDPLCSDKAHPNQHIWDIGCLDGNRQGNNEQTPLIDFDSDPMPPNKSNKDNEGVTQTQPTPSDTQIRETCYQQLVWAIQDGFSDFVRAVTEQKDTNINMQGSDGKTALIHAADCGHLKIVQILLDKGADIDVEDSQRRTALMYAIDNKYRNIIQILLDVALIRAIDNGAPNIVETLIDQGANLDAKDSQGRTALMRAQQIARKKAKAVENTIKAIEKEVNMAKKARDMGSRYG